MWGWHLVGLVAFKRGGASTTVFFFFHFRGIIAAMFCVPTTLQGAVHYPIAGRRSFTCLAVLLSFFSWLAFVLLYVSVCAQYDHMKDISCIL